MSISNQVNADLAFDTDTMSEPDPALSQLPFIQGADVYNTGSPTHDERVSVQLISRGGGGLDR